jgi:chemotaxis protein methyltransferase CheR
MSSDKELNGRVKALIYNLAGITLQDNKDIMIKNRIQKLLRDTTFGGSIDELLDEVENGHFTTDFINAFTTNKTHFFREVFHFEDLKERILKSYESSKPLSIYCSAASTGEEPYSIAMTVIEAQKEYSRDINAHITATDIDTNVLTYAANGIYRHEKSSKEFPAWIKPNRYFKRRVKQGFSTSEVLIKVNDELKRMVSFYEMNLNNEHYPFEHNEFDIIFCRNVLIYFTVEDQEKIIKRLFSHLKIGGTLYLGHSETPHGISEAVQRLGQNIFVKLKDL